MEETMSSERVAIVTGAAGGIGAATAELLAGRGYSVALMDRDAGRLQETTRLLADAGQDVHAWVLDVTDPESIGRALAEVVDRWGFADALVNNAGFVPSGPVHLTSPDDWRRGIDVNLTSQFLMARAVIPLMRANRHPAIVNMSSSSGKRAAANSGAYAASKFGVIGLTQSLALDVAHLGIRVNAVCPARVETPLTGQRRAFLAAERAVPEQQVQDEWAAEIPLGRLADPVEVAETVHWLLSRRSSYVTGESVNVSGGLVNW